MTMQHVYLLCTRVVPGLSGLLTEQSWSQAKELTSWQTWSEGLAVGIWVAQVARCATSNASHCLLSDGGCAYRSV